MTAHRLAGRLASLESRLVVARARVSAVPHGEPDDGGPSPQMTEAEWLSRYGRDSSTHAPRPAETKEDRS
jgi:hypothetical protein